MSRTSTTSLCRVRVACRVPGSLLGLVLALVVADPTLALDVPPREFAAPPAAPAPRATDHEGPVEACLLEPAEDGPVTVRVLPGRGELRKAASRRGSVEAVRVQPDLVAFSDGLVLTTGLDHASRAINELGWSARPLVIGDPILSGDEAIITDDQGWWADIKNEYRRRMRAQRCRRP